MPSDNVKIRYINCRQVHGKKAKQICVHLLEQTTCLKTMQGSYKIIEIERTRWKLVANIPRTGNA